MPRFPLDEWTAGQLRLTAFVSSHPKVGAEQLWESVVGSPPDHSSASPKKGTSQVSAAYGTGKLTLRLEPGRVDWVMEPDDIDPAALQADPFFSFGPWVEGLDAFGRLAEDWLRRGDTPPVERAAFGSVLLHREASKEAAYDRLGDYIPVSPSVDSSDFLYQINHPIASAIGIEELRINRLTKWSAGVFRAVSFALSSKGGFAGAVEGEAAFALRLELDINTVPEFPGPIAKERLLDIYLEMVGLGRQIAADGLSRA